MYASCTSSYQIARYELRSATGELIDRIDRGIISLSVHTQFGRNSRSHRAAYEIDMFLRTIISTIRPGVARLAVFFFG